VLIAAGNSNERSLVAPVERLLTDNSALVRGAAAWAMGQLVPHYAFTMAGEADPEVLAELQQLAGQQAP
jgi:epoxyqueuosine reductase